MSQDEQIGKDRVRTVSIVAAVAGNIGLIGAGLSDRAHQFIEGVDESLKIEVFSGISGIAIGAVAIVIPITLSLSASISALASTGDQAGAARKAKFRDAAVTQKRLLISLIFCLIGIANLIGLDGFLEDMSGYSSGTLSAHILNYEGNDIASLAEGSLAGTALVVALSYLVSGISSLLVLLNREISLPEQSASDSTA